MKLYIISGESSGDLHGSNLVKALKQRLPQLEVRGMGGDRMEASGVQLVQHYREMNYMGFVEVLAHLRKILRNMRMIKADILAYCPDAVICIDYPAFNMRIAAFCKMHNMRVIYYISPQVWAWKTSRVKKLRATTERMITILPFEKEFYAGFGVDVDYVGHPLLDAVAEMPADDAFRMQYAGDSRPLVALLPGSRKMEIEKMLSVMLQVADRFSGKYRFIIGAAPSVPADFYEAIIGNRSHVQVVYNKTYALLRNSDAAIVTSGTATLETALFNVPQVVCYRGNPISYQLARRLIKVKYISLVNLVLDKQAVKELIQSEMTAGNIASELEHVLGRGREEQLENYRLLREMLGNSGASGRAAAIVEALLKNAGKPSA